MPKPHHSQEQRDFRCEFCHGLIRIPADLPPTKGPCPHCKNTITSPAPGVYSADAPAPGETEPLGWTKGPKIGGNDAEVAEMENQKNNRSRLAAGIGAAAVVLVVGLGGMLVLREMKKPPIIPKDEALAESTAAQQAHYRQSGWKKDAYQVLDAFLKGATVNEKALHVLRADELAGTMAEFYTSAPIDDSDTPAEAFSVYNLSDEDKQRGLFMMVFDQPPQFSMRDFFRPLATLEVQYGLVEADLLLGSMARTSNFTMDPLRVHAFFRKTPDGLKLDWEIFTQTKHRQLARFLEEPKIGSKKIFRVFIMEDVMDARFSVDQSRTYRIADPANTDHSARIVVADDSEIGRELSQINWIGMDGESPQSRTATVELEWHGNEIQPQLAIRRFLCWEFLGLGGETSATTTEQK